MHLTVGIAAVQNRSRLKNKCKPNDMKQNIERPARHSSNTLVSRSQFKPILFSTDMVKAILAGRKTQTRRIVKQAAGWDINWKVIPIKEEHLDGIQRYEIRCGTQYYLPWFKAKCNVGDILWVRETFFYGGEMDENEQVSECRYLYRADNDWQQLEWVDENEDLRNAPKWKPSIFMPKEACRLFLEVTDIRAERLQDITEEDAIAEGINLIDTEDPYTYGYELYGVHYITDVMGRKAVTGTEIESYQTLWQKINGVESWEANPYVWVITFKVVECPQGFC